MRTRAILRTCRCTSSFLAAAKFEQSLSKKSQISIALETLDVMSVEGVGSLARISEFKYIDENVVVDQPRLQDQHDGILNLPVELVLKVFQNLNLDSAFRLSETCKKLHGVFIAHHEALTLAVLAVELSPLDSLLQCIVQKGEDLAVPLGPCLRRRIYHRGKLVSEGETPAPREEAHILLPPVSLDQEHFRRLISAHRLVKDWEQLFPRYRFRGCATDCRELRSHEKERLRGAIYRWMSYAQYFHGDFKRPSRLIPRARSMDIRCRKLRVLSTMELIELEDLWDTVVSIVGHLDLDLLRLETDQERRRSHARSALLLNKS